MTTVTQSDRESFGARWCGEDVAPTDCFMLAAHYPKSCEIGLEVRVYCLDIGSNIGWLVCFGGLELAIGGTHGGSRAALLAEMASEGLVGLYRADLDAVSARNIETALLERFGRISDADL